MNDTSLFFSLGVDLVVGAVAGFLGTGAVSGLARYCNNARWRMVVAALVGCAASVTLGVIAAILIGKMTRRPPDLTLTAAVCAIIGLLAGLASRLQALIGGAIAGLAFGAVTGNGYFTNTIVAGMGGLLTGAVVLALVEREKSTGQAVTLRKGVPHALSADSADSGRMRCICPHCRKRLTVKASHAGRRIQCPNAECRHSFAAPPTTPKARPIA